MNMDILTSYKDNCGFGLLASINNTPTHQNVEDAIISLELMVHRGAIAADGKSGDGSGLLFSMPVEFMKTQAKDTGSGLFVAEGNSVNGYAVRTTSQLAANTAIFGNFSDLIIGQFGAVEVVTDRSAQSGALTIGIFTDVDTAVRHAESFCKGA